MADKQQLNDEINALRSNLGLPDRKQRDEDTSISLEKEKSVYEAQVSVRDYWLHKLDDPASRDEVLFALQFFSLIPLPLWTSKKNRGIAYWNKYAELAYGYKSHLVLNEDFVNLFVNDAEQKQAIDDLEDITEGREGLQHFNLANDKDVDGRTKKILTCCFAVFDPRIGEVTQAEVSFDVSLLDEHQAELDELVVKWENLQGRREEFLAEERSFELQNLMLYHRRFSEKCDERKRSCDDDLSDPSLASAQRDQKQKDKAEWSKWKSDLTTWYIDMKYKLEECETGEELQKLQDQIEKQKQKYHV